MSAVRRLMGFAVASGRVGFAFLVDGELMDWRLSIRASRSFDAAFKQALTWISYYRPELVVLEQIEADSRKGAHSRQLLLAIESAANNANVDHVSIPRPSGGPNKYVDAAGLAQEFPQIAAWLPSKRRLWEKEPRNIIYFEALSLAWGWWRSSGQGSGVDLDAA